MADAPTVPAWLAADRGWLADQPGMTPWPAAANRIVRTLTRWAKDYTATLRIAHPGPDCLPRLWACWSHHWRTAVERAGGPVDGFAVAAQIEAGRGYCRGGNLGGNVLRDVVLAAAMLRRDDAAVRRFEAEYKDTVVRQVTAVRRFAGHESEWWNDLLADLVGVGKAGRDGRLARFSGRSGLAGWTVTVAVRFLADRVTRRPPTADLGDDLIDPTAGTLRGVISADCLELLTGRVRDALAALSPRERLALRLSVVDGLQGQQIAGVFRINPGNVSRLLQSARDALWRHLSADGDRADAVRECFADLVAGGADRDLADTLRAALEAEPARPDP